MENLIILTTKVQKSTNIFQLKDMLNRLFFTTRTIEVWIKNIVAATIIDKLKTINASNEDIDNILFTISVNLKEQMNNTLTNKIIKILMDDINKLTESNDFDNINNILKTKTFFYLTTKTQLFNNPKININDKVYFKIINKMTILEQEGKDYIAEQTKNIDNIIVSKKYSAEKNTEIIKTSINNIFKSNLNKKEIDTFLTEIIYRLKFYDINNFFYPESIVNIIFNQIISNNLEISLSNIFRFFDREINYFYKSLLNERRKNIRTEVINLINNILVNSAYSKQGFNFDDILSIILGNNFFNKDEKNKLIYILFLKKNLSKTQQINVFIEYLSKNSSQIYNNEIKLEQLLYMSTKCEYYPLLLYFQNNFNNFYEDYTEQHYIKQYTTLEQEQKIKAYLMDNSDIEKFNILITNIMNTFYISNEQKNILLIDILEIIDRDFFTRKDKAEALAIIVRNASNVELNQNCITILFQTVIKNRDFVLLATYTDYFGNNFKEVYLSYLSNLSPDDITETDITFCSLNGLKLENGRLIYFGPIQKTAYYDNNRLLYCFIKQLFNVLFLDCDENSNELIKLANRFDLSKSEDEKQEIKQNFLKYLCKNIIECLPSMINLFSYNFVFKTTSINKGLYAQGFNTIEIKNELINFKNTIEETTKNFDLLHFLKQFVNSNKLNENINNFNKNGQFDSSETNKFIDFILNNTSTKAQKDLFKELNSFIEFQPNNYDGFKVEKKYFLNYKTGTKLGTDLSTKLESNLLDEVYTEENTSCIVK